MTIKSAPFVSSSSREPEAARRAGASPLTVEEDVRSGDEGTALMNDLFALWAVRYAQIVHDRPLRRPLGSLIGRR